MTQSSFQKALQQFDKVACTEMVLQALNEKTIDIVSLYSEIIVPTLNAVASDSQPQQIPIWAEHVQSAIVRGVMEIAYPYLLKESQLLEVQIDAAISKPKALARVFSMFMAREVWQQHHAVRQWLRVSICGSLERWCGQTEPYAIFHRRRRIAARC